MFGLSRRRHSLVEDALLSAIVEPDRDLPCASTFFNMLCDMQRAETARVKERFETIVYVEQLGDKAGRVGRSDHTLLTAGSFHADARNPGLKDPPLALVLEHQPIRKNITGRR